VPTFEGLLCNRPCASALRLCNDMRFRTHREGRAQALAQAARHVAKAYALYALRLAVVACASPVQARERRAPLVRERRSTLVTSMVASAAWLYLRTHLGQKKQCYQRLTGPWEAPVPRLGWEAEVYR
jgi:hypothetical protein